MTGSNRQPIADCRAQIKNTERKIDKNYFLYNLVVRVCPWITLSFLVSLNPKSDFSDLKSVYVLS